MTAYQRPQPSSPPPAEARTGVVAASYERVSTRVQGQHGFSLGQQHRSAEEFTRAQGWRLPERLRFRDGEDADASGASWDLPGLTAMLEAARRGDFQVLVVPDFDRFARSLTKGLVLEDQLKEYGVRVVCQKLPLEDTPEGRLLKHQLLSFAEYERERIGLRTQLGKRGKALAGEVVGTGSHPPYGYRFTYRTRANVRRACGLEPDPATAPIARRILADLRTRSTVEIADALNAEGVPGARPGSRWNSLAIRRIATNPVYCGTWVYGRNGRRVTPDDEVGIRVPVQALISREEWDGVQRALAGRTTLRRARVPVDEDPYLLRGLLTCGHCRGALHTRENGGPELRYYACLRHIPARARSLGKPVCELPDVPARDLEAELWRQLEETLLDERSLAAGLRAAEDEHARADGLRRDRLAALDGEVARQRKRLDALAAKLADVEQGELMDAVLRQSADIERLIAKLRAEREELVAGQAAGLSPAEAEAIETFAAEVRAGMALATPVERRELVRLLQVRGIVYRDADGVALGRRHRFRVEWTAAFPLPNNGTRLLKRDDP